METEGLSEEEMIDSLFYRCDIHDEGRVQISTIIQFLKNCLGNGNVGTVCHWKKNFYLKDYSHILKVCLMTSQDSLSSRQKD